MSKKQRLAVDVAPAVKVRLEALKTKTECDSMSEVVRRALAVYELLVRDNGRLLTTVDDAGTVVKYTLY